MGGTDVAHGGLFGDAEQPHQLEGIGALERLVEDPVLTQAGQRQDLREGRAQRADIDGRVVGIDSGLLADQQVGVGRGGPPQVAVGRPIGGKLVGELLQVEGVPQQPALYFEGAEGEGARVPRILDVFDEEPTCRRPRSAASTTSSRTAIVRPLIRRGA